VVEVAVEHVLWSFAVGVVAFVVIDAVWLGLVMRQFYRRELSPIARMSNGKLAPIWPAAILVYVLLAIGVVALALPGGGVPASRIAASGATLGLVVYGVYNLTNFATLAAWSRKMTIVDIAWGTLLCAAVATLVAAMDRWMP
jgi:uncharacterized membrane protein